MTDDKNYMNCLLDAEIKSDDADAFGHRHFAAALENLIESPVNKPPYTIGVLGKWGTGKSSIKQLYLWPLEEARKAAASKRESVWRRVVAAFGRKESSEPGTREDRIYCITFNAWRFGGENIKRALLRHVFMKLGGDERSINDALFRQVQRQEAEPRSFPAMLREAYDKWLWALVQVAIVFGIIVGGLFLIRGVSAASAEWLSGVIITLYALAGAATIQALLDPKRFLISRYSTTTRVESPRTSAEEYEDLLVYQLKNFRSSKQGSKVERIVIFVDDLDRLSAEEMVSGLDAIRTFMEMPDERLPEKMGIVFVVSCDEDRVADALAARSRAAGDDDLRHRFLVLGDARRFLDRIFQFRLEIPPFPKQDMRAFALKKLREELKPLAEALEAQKVSLEDLVERMIPVSVQSPRNALHILNAFVQGWWLATEREAVSSEQQRGGLPKGAVTNYPLALAALCTLRVNFPDFYNDLQQEPSLIQYFTDRFIDRVGASSKDAFDQLPERTASILEGYHDEASGSLRRIHWPLRQYLASLRALNWPASLQPILVFSQDPVARKFGDKYERVYADLVSGNVPGVLDGLGYKNDAESLSRDHARQLYDWVEDILDRETHVRQDSAATVLATLAGRLPKEQARWLLNRLAKRLASFSDLRWRIRVPTIRDVLEHARPDDRKEVVGKIIDDLLFPGSGVIEPPDTGSLWSVGDVRERVRDAVSLALWARRQDNGNGLDPSHNSKLFQWLANRRIPLRQDTLGLPFDDFEAWMTKYESDLLPSLGLNYANALVAELKAERIKEMDAEPAFSKARRVIENLEKGGPPSQNSLWTLLTDFMSVKIASAGALSLEFGERNYKSASALEIQPFVQTLTERLVTTDADEDHKSLDKKRAASVLLDILETRWADLDWNPLVDLSDQPQRSLQILLDRWSSSEEDGESAVRLFSCIRKANAEKADSLIRGWAWRVLTNLSNYCRRWLAEEFATSLTDEQRAAVIESLAALFDTSAADMYSQRPDRFDKFQAFLGKLPPEAFKIAELRRFIEELFTIIEDLSSDPKFNSYIYKIFPALAGLIEHAPADQVERVLAKLFTDYTGNAHLYGFLHEHMADYWPRSRGEVSEYDPARFFNDGHRIALENGSDSFAMSILTSMHKMVQRRVIDHQNSATVIETAYYLWPFHQEECLKILLSYEQAPEPKRVADLMDSVEESQQDQLDRLSKAWSHMANYIEDREASEVTELILGKRYVDSEPDIFLQLWISALANRKGFHLLLRLLLRFISIRDLSDEARGRVLRAIAASAADVDSTAVFESMEEALKVNDERTLDAIIDIADKALDLLSERVNSMKRGDEVRPIMVNELSLSMIDQKAFRHPKWKKIEALIEKENDIREEFDKKIHSFEFLSPARNSFEVTNEDSDGGEKDYTA